jgi:hypothetical protein
MSYILKIGDKEVGKVDSIKTPQLKEVSKQTKGFDFETFIPTSNYGFFDAIGIPALIELGKSFENVRQHYIFSLLNPEE